MKIFRFLFILAFFTLGGLMIFQACEDKAITEQSATPEQQINEAGEPLGAAPVAGINTYASYYLVRGAGAIVTTGAVWVNSTAWYTVPAGQVEDRGKFLSDLITTLDREGVLAGVDLTKTKANWLIVLSPGQAPPYVRKWILDSRDLNFIPAPK